MGFELTGSLLKHPVRGIGEYLGRIWPAGCQWTGTEPCPLFAEGPH